MNIRVSVAPDLLQASTTLTDAHNVVGACVSRRMKKTSLYPADVKKTQAQELCLHDLQQRTPDNKPSPFLTRHTTPPTGRPAARIPFPTQSAEPPAPLQGRLTPPGQAG